jgi:GTP-binding protein Era
MFDCSIRRPWIYIEGEVCDMSQSERVVEIIKEKVLQRLNQELPYLVSQKVFDWRKDSEGTLYIEQLLQVDNQRHKMMIIGKDGQVLKGIASRAERDIQKILECPVKLKLTVAVRKHGQYDGGLYENSYDI